MNDGRNGMGFCSVGCGYSCDLLRVEISGGLMTKIMANLFVVALAVTMAAGVVGFVATWNSWWLWAIVVPFVIFYAG